jgi:hypothetical protein
MEEIKPLCACGCGMNTSIVTQDDKRRDLKKGDYSKYVQGHSSAKKVKNVIGTKFNRLTIDKFSRSENGKRSYECICDCGKRTTLILNQITSGTVKSCGCLKVESYYKRRKGKNTERRMLHAAKSRARISGIQFSIGLEDIIIPEICPYFGIAINRDNENSKDDSPSLDRIDSQKGYIKGNVEVISQRANQIKNNGSCEEHRLIADRMKTFM